MDVRLVGILSACTIKIPKPRPDGTVGQKWAILQLDDGNGTIDAFCFAKAWEKCSALETKVDQLVMLCGEVSRRVNYGKDDKFEKKDPEIGDYNFTVREAYPLEDALPQISKALRIRLRQDDPHLLEQVNKIRSVIEKNPGGFPVCLDLVWPNGTGVAINLGATRHITPSLSFFSELAKVVPLGDTTFGCSDKIYLAPAERKWEG